MSIDPIFWLLAAVGFLALEGMTFSMVSVWFAAGSAAALLCCLFTHSFRVQAVVFIAVSAVCLLAFKPLAKRLHKQPTPTNGDRALGREARVLTPVSAQQTGRVRLDGVDWSARCATPGDTLTPGQACRVTEIHSTLLISTHQAHDFENLLDHLVILGKGEILLNRSLDEISNRLLFARTDILPAESIYSEQDLSGHFSILPNEDEEENTPDIELLYKAVLQQPEKIQSMFQ